MLEVCKYKNGFLIKNITSEQLRKYYSTFGRKAKIISVDGVYSLYLSRLNIYHLRFFTELDSFLSLSPEVQSEIEISQEEVLRDAIAQYTPEEIFPDVDFKRYVDLDLYDFQERAIRRAFNQFSYGLFFEMRCGKTITSLVLSALWFEKGIIDSIVVVSPLSAVEGWQKEIERMKIPEMKHFFAPDYKSMLKLKKAISNCCSVGILPIIHFHYEFWRTKRWEEFLNEVLGSVGKFVLILDESHKVKNPQSKVHKILYALSRYAKRTLLLTGTPIGNTIEDLWAQSKFLNLQHKLGETLTKFRAKFMYSIPGMYGWFERKGARQQVLYLISNSVMSVSQKDVFKTQKVFMETLHYDLNSEQRRVYDGIVDRIQFDLKDGKITINNALTRSLKLLQVCSGFVIDDSGVVEDFTSGKDKLMLDVLDTYSDIPIVIWTIFDYEADKLLRLINKKLKRKAIVVDGRTPKDKRTNLISLFKEGSYNVLISKPQVLSLGTDLSNSRIAIFYSRSYSHIDREQALSRLLNPEVKSAIAIIDLVGRSTVEERVLEILNKKKEISEEVKSYTSFIKLIKRS